MRIKISNSAFDDTEGQKTILTVVQLVLNHLGKCQLRHKAGVFYTYIYLVKKQMENLISKILKLIKVIIFFSMVDFGTMLPRLGNDTVCYIINHS